MLAFFAENWATIVVAGILAAVVVLIVLRLRKNRKAGKTSCGCGCENCPSAGICRK